MTNFHTRLKEERKRLGLTQALWGAQVGVSADAQLNYENGSRAPTSDYLERAAVYGMDVLYLLTGNRTPVRQRIIAAVENDQSTVDTLPVLVLDERAQALVANYAAADEEGKRLLEGFATFAAQPQRARAGQGGK
jgi:transcriptional regulator with XRE-family HTH domain